MSRATTVCVVPQHGTALVGIGIGGVVAKDTCMPPSLVLNIREPEGRSASLLFWSDEQTAVGESQVDQFEGLTWSLVGTGVVFRKADVHSPLWGGRTYGVAALWPVMAGADDNFAQAGEENAVASVESEPSCLAFGVFRSSRFPTVFALVEVFDNETSFTKHMETEHFQRFAEYARPRYLGDRSQTVRGVATWA
jgi:quinol monooxygenase YgiN